MWVNNMCWQWIFKSQDMELDKVLLKKNNEENVMVERKGSLTIGDETKGVMFVNDLTNNTLYHINWLSNLQDKEDLKNEVDLGV